MKAHVPARFHIIRSESLVRVYNIYCVVRRLHAAAVGMCSVQ